MKKIIVFFFIIIVLNCYLILIILIGFINDLFMIIMFLIINLFITHTVKTLEFTLSIIVNNQ